ncbi:MAG: SGNH/GDSL hydrolase family protein, partial [Candidatus Omnitrophica bacterium]|nr:SGNH/GDSL hydrolase family protein [Candidatus Omnitrophota bacterium]
GIKVQCFFDQTIGQNTSEILAKLPQHIKKYRPQLIIFLVGVNNWWNMDRSNILLFHKNTGVSQATLKILMFLDQFRVWKLFKNMAFPSGFSKERWDFFYPGPGEAREELEGEKWEGAPIFDKLAEHDIVEMIKICKANRIPAILCTYPVAAMNLRRIQKDIAGRYQVPLVDNYAAFQKLKDQKAHLWPEDYWHPNDAGYAIVAENIYHCILENGWIESEAKKGSR